MRARHLHRVRGSRHLAAAHREETHERSWLPYGATTNGVSDCELNMMMTTMMTRESRGSENEKPLFRGVPSWTSEFLDR